MGNSDSKSKKKDKKKKDKKSGKSDDGCIGNRRVRTIILCGLLIAFCVFSFGYLEQQRDAYATLNDVFGDFVDAYGTIENGWNCVLAGCVFIFVFAIITIVLFFIPNCDDKLGRIPGIGLIIGGALWIIGMLVYIFGYKDFINYDALPSDTQSDLDSFFALWFGEALLPSATAIALGIDVLLHFFENEGFRLSTNFGIILAVASLCFPSYYNLSGGSFTPDGVELIASGYLILWWVTLIYIILYILTCCTCDCKDRCLIRFGFAIALVVGGVFTALGYWIFAGDLGTNSDEWVAYYVGYTVLICGLCITWALDIAFDDVKNR